MPTSVGPNIVEDDLLLYLDAGIADSYTSGSSTWYDLSGNGNNATLYNTPSFNPNNRLGAFEFDGTYEYLNFNELSFTNQAFTLEFWGQIINFNSRRTIYIGDFPGELSDDYVFFTALKEDGVTNFRNFGSGAWPYKVPTGEPFMWNYVHYSDRTSTYAVNGNLNPLDNDDLSSFTDITFKFNGFGRNSSRPYYGDLYSMRVYNRALTASELKANYTSQKSRFNL